MFLHHRDGHRVPVTVRVVPMKNENGEVVGAVETFHDDTARAEALERAEQMEEMAFIDALTRVGNRRFAEFVIADRLGEWQRYKWSFALLFIDVDHFKKVNDVHGHATRRPGSDDGRAHHSGSGPRARLHRSLGRRGVRHGRRREPTSPAADRVAERVRSLVESSGLAHANRREIAVTVSIGATFPSPTTPSKP